MSRIRLRHRSEVSALRSHIDELSRALWIGTARSWWPRFLFHCTDIRNVVNVLESGELLSRTQVNRYGHLPVDIAAPDIINQTDTRWHDYVRLYFRPKTPTQYNNEGFRPVGQRKLGAHCPVPVYLLFEASAVLSRQDSLFTDGNLASGVDPKHTINELRQMPFQLIYHDTWFGSDEKQKIVYHRNAEVLIPQRLGLSTVQRILCRSQAEYETLLNLLSRGARNRWVGKIGVVPKLNLFNSKWSFVQQVEMSGQSMLFRFNRNTETPGPFRARVEIYAWSFGDSRKYTWANGEYQADTELKIALSNPSNPHDYSVLLYLDDHLAFKGYYEDYNLPF